MLSKLGVKAALRDGGSDYRSDRSRIVLVEAA